MSVKKRFEDKFGTQASPAIDKYLNELNKKDKVTIHVSYSEYFLSTRVIFSKNSSLTYIFSGF